MESKEKKVKSDFINPFDKGVSYDAFLKAVKDSGKSVENYCKDKIEANLIEWLEKEIELLNNKNN